MSWMKRFPFPLPWFGMGLLALFLVSLGLRFWGLERFNSLVFDEVYYANFARGYLDGVQEFGGHPPLTNYIIAFGIRLAEQFHWGNPQLQNDLTGRMMTTFSYRWLNALTGSFLPLIVAGIAYLLSDRRSFAMIAGALVLLDGLYLVESRYALNNIYLITFGLLGHLFLLMALRLKAHRGVVERTAVYGCLLISGIGFGASVAIKWNGMGFLLGAYLVYVVVWVCYWLNRWRPGLVALPLASGSSPVQTLQTFSPLTLLLFLAVVPFLTYYVSWLPYIHLDPSTSFWEWQGQILDYHHRVGGMDAHAYCSPWYTWPLMWRPVAYFYKTAQSINDPVPVIGPPLAQSNANVVYDVHAMGNPILWWLATAALIVLLLTLLDSWVNGWRKNQALGATSSDRTVSVSGSPAISAQLWVAFYLVLNWLSNWLPWADVSRCTFLYHYMAASVFASLALALLIDRWLRSQQYWQRTIGLTFLLLVGLAFVFWLPLFLGLPISPEGFYLRQWFRSWI